MKETLRRFAPLIVTAVALGGVSLLLSSGSGSSTGSTSTSTTEPRALSERPAFGRSLPGAVAYLAEDRIFDLVDLGTGKVIGSKGIEGERRPAAASATRAYLGRLPAVGTDANWDAFRSVPWFGTEYRDHGRGVSMAYSPMLDVVASAMRPLPGGGNGVLMVAPDRQWIAAESSGHWAFATWAGDDLLVRELTADATNFWLLSGREPSAPRRVDLPAEFLPIAATTGWAMGAIGEEGVIVSLETGEMRRLSGRFSWAAAWQPSRDHPQIATVGGFDPPSIISYTTAGTFAWSAPLREPVTRFGGGVAWSPDGDFVVVATDGTLEAYTDQGGTIGRLDPGLPDPQDEMAFVAVVVDADSG